MEGLKEAGFIPVYMDTKEKEWESYVCQKDGALLRAVILKNVHSAGRLVPFMLKQKCADFNGQFYLGGNYCAVYAYKEGQKLSGLLEERACLTHAVRAEIAKNVVKELIKKRVDFETAASILSAQNINVSQDNGISFIYAPPLLEAGQPLVYSLLSGLIKQIWGDGLTAEAELWLTRLETGQFGAIHEAYSKMPANPFAEAAPPECKIKEPFNFSALFEKVRLLLALAAVAAAAVVAVLLITNLRGGGEAEISAAPAFERIIRKAE